MDRALISILEPTYELHYSVLVPCVWGPWSKFSQCDRSCGGGKMFKSRTKLVTEQYGGTCPGWDKVIKNCNPEPCPGESLFIHFLKRPRSFQVEVERC